MKSDIHPTTIIECALELGEYVTKENIEERIGSYAFNTIPGIDFVHMMMIGKLERGEIK